MIITVTVNKCCAPQTVFPTDGPRVLLGPGESLTADFSAEQEEYLRASPGHYTVTEAKPVATQAANPIDLSAASAASVWKPPADWTVVIPTTVEPPKPAPKPRQPPRRRRGRH